MIFGKQRAAIENSKISKLYTDFYFNNMPIQTLQSLTRYVDEGYMSNEIIYSIVSKIAGTASNIPIKLYSTNGTEQKAHWALSLIDSPNEDTTLQELLYALYVYYLTTGNAYLYSPSLMSKERIEGWVLPSDLIEVISGGAVHPIKGYQLSYGTRGVTLPKRDILHMKMFNPQFMDGHFIYGLSPIKVAADIINSVNTGNARMQQMLETGIPPFVLSAKSKDGLTDKQQSQLEASYKRKYNGTGKSNQPLLSNVELSVEKLGYSAVDLDIIAHYEAAQRVLCSIYGVSTILFNETDSTAYNNYSTAVVSFYDDVVKTLNSSFTSKLNRFLFPNGDFYFAFDYSNVAALTKARATLMQAYNSVTFLTDDEKREVFGYKAIGGTNDNA